MSEDVVTHININNIELLAPVVAANLLNTVRLEELIALQKGKEFNRETAMLNIIQSWSKLTTGLREAQKKAMKQEA